MPTREPREVTESFRIERVLKSSRSGIVFRALDPATGVPFAIKLIPPPAPAVMAACHARFVALAELVTLLQPHGVPTLHDYGFTPDGSAFLVMDLVDGMRLDRLEDLPPARVVGIALNVVETLAALAGKGVQHGNLSPDNVLVSQGDRIWVTGLGTAALRPPGTLARVVLDGEAAEFAAPERFDAASGGATDWRADLYSLALTVCSLLKAEVGSADAPAPTVRLSFEVAKGLRDPNVLRATLEQSLRRAPEGRPPSYEDLREAFRRALGAPAAAADQPTGRRDGAREPAGPSAVAAPAAPAGAAPVKAGAAPSGPLSDSGMEWEEPEGAPKWLQESSPAFVLDKPEPRQIEPPLEPEHDEREDTNPVPLTRKAELPLKPKREAPAAAPPAAPAAAPVVAPAIGAPRPQPTPPIAAPIPAPPPAALLPRSVPPAAAPPALPAAASLAPQEVASGPVRPQPRPAPPPAHPAGAPAALAPAPPAVEAASPPAAPSAGRPLESTPPTGSYELPGEAGLAVAASAGAADEPPAEDAVPPAVEAPADAVLEVAPAPPRPAAAQRPAASTAKGRRWLVVALASAAVLLAGSVGIFVGMQMLRSRQALPTAPSPVPTRPRPTAVPQPGVPQAALASIGAAEQAAATGDLDAAQAALDAITSDDELALAPTDLGRLTRVRASISGLRRDAILGDLRTGLGNGNLKVLRDAVRRITREDEAALAGDPDAGQTLDEARRAVNLYSLVTKAQQAGNDAQLLQQASALLEVVPKSSQAADLREKAASGLERDADALVQRGRFEEALGRLDTLSRYWSVRPGIGQRLERIHAAQAAEQKLATLLTEAELAERDRQPDRGLDLLRSVTPPPYYEERFRQARGRLEVLLQQLDANPPTLDIPTTPKLEYQKNKPFALTVRISDDHGVKSATLYVRIKGSDHYQDLPLVRGSGNEWRGEITPALHQNKAVEFYVVAADQSGHTGQAGSADQPLQLKKKWSLFGM